MPRKEPNKEGYGNTFKPIPREENMVVMNSDLKEYNKRQMYKARLSNKVSARGKAKTNKR